MLLTSSNFFLNSSSANFQSVDLIDFRSRFHQNCNDDHEFVSCFSPALVLVHEKRGAHTDHCRQHKNEHAVLKTPEKTSSVSVLTGPGS